MVVTAMTVGGMQPSDKAMTAVDVNRATVTELMTVPGMTEVWARRIVRFRPYRRKTDLVDHGVISAEEYGKIRNYVVAHRVAEERGKQANTQ
jgi:DNA uptake protein ComE-like DNA-binding protein